jgi:Tol biopolymer transport system component
VLLFARQGTLIAQRFDPARGVLSGEAVTIADPVGADDQKSAKDWMSAAGGPHVWRTRTPTERQIVWYDRAGRELAPVTSPGMFHEPILSPDGSLVVIGRPDESGTTSLWGYQTAAKDRATRLTFGAESAESALITPDGNGLIYTRGGLGKSSIVRRALNGTGTVEALFDSPYRVWADDCSPDGRFLICEGGSAANFDLLLLPLEGERKLTPFASSPANETHATFSPDGKLVAYVSDESGQGNVYVQPFPATGTKGQVSTEGADLPRWSADGSELYYVTATRKLTAVAVKSAMPFVAGDATPLFSTRIPALTATGNHTFFLPSRDGKRFLVMSNVGGGTDTAFRVAIDVALPFAK